jgi:hypothetical protein
MLLPESNGGVMWLFALVGFTGVHIYTACARLSSIQKKHATQKTYLFITVLCPYHPSNHPYTISVVSWLSMQVKTSSHQKPENFLYLTCHNRGAGKKCVLKFRYRVAGMWHPTS